MATQYMTIAQFMRRFQVSRSTVYRLKAAGVIVTVKIGRAIRIPIHSVESWVRALEGANDNDV